MAGYYRGMWAPKMIKISGLSGLTRSDCIIHFKEIAEIAYPFVSSITRCYTFVSHKKVFKLLIQFCIILYPNYGR